jgi:hypothetical protein
MAVQKFKYRTIVKLISSQETINSPIMEYDEDQFKIASRRIIGVLSKGDYYDMPDADGNAVFIAGRDISTIILEKN